MMENIFFLDLEIGSVWRMDLAIFHGGEIAFCMVDWENVFFQDCDGQGS